MMDCKHKRYTVDVAEQTGRCMDCGAEGRMEFVVGNPVAAERERCAKLCEDLDNDENTGPYRMAAHWAACRIRGA